MKMFDEAIERMSDVDQVGKVTQVRIRRVSKPVPCAPYKASRQKSHAETIGGNGKRGNDLSSGDSWTKCNRIDRKHIFSDSPEP